MNRNGGALPDDDGFETSPQREQGESPLDAFVFEQSLAKDTSPLPPDEDPMDFFADEEPVPGILELPVELSAVSRRTPGVSAQSRAYARRWRSAASAEALVMTVIVMGMFTAMVLFNFIRDGGSSQQPVAAADSDIPAVMQPVASFIAKPLVRPRSLARADTTDSNVKSDRIEPVRPQPQPKEVIARPTIRSLSPPVSATVSARPGVPSPLQVPRAIDTSNTVMPPAAPPSPVMARNTESLPPPVKEPSTERSSSPTDTDVIQRVLARYRAAFNVLDSDAAKAIWPTVDTRALARAFKGLETQNLEFDSCDVAVTGAQASANCNGKARYVPKVGHRVSYVESRNWRFALKKSGTEWVIDQVDAR